MPQPTSCLLVLPLRWSTAHSPDAFYSGELYPGDAGGTCGYLSQSELSDERLLPDLFSAGSSERMYQIGGLVRYWSNGTVEWPRAGGVQVKISGSHIQPGEAEACLADSEGSHHSVMLPREDQLAEVHLGANLINNGPNHARDAWWYTRPYDESCPPTGGARFVPVADIPLIQNGKIDREVLRARDRQPDERGEVGPTTPGEELRTRDRAEAQRIYRVDLHVGTFDMRRN
jgi:hypothetical protein